MKTCTFCKNPKPLSAFYKKKKNESGLNAWCISCCSAKESARRLRLKERKCIQLPLEKQCRTCGEIRPASAFSRCKSKKDGLLHCCKACNSERQRVDRIARPTRYMVRHAKAKGHAAIAITDTQLTAFIANHSGVCDFRHCNDPAEHTDHDHKTGVLRGRTCRRHNLGMGLFRDSIEELQAAIYYLRKHQKQNAA
jgi:Recombination endonuclease VII